MPILLTAAAREIKGRSLREVSLQVTSAKLLIPILALLILTAGTAQPQKPLSKERGSRRATTFVHTGWQFREAGKDK
jgi:hypothetical protein